MAKYMEYSKKARLAAINTYKYNLWNYRGD